MKRNEKRVPGFDEIIFRNRNKSYGAYDLRKRYKSAASISVISVLVFSAAVMLLASSLSPKEASAVSNPGVIVILKPADFNPNNLVPPEVKLPVIHPPAKPGYIPPVVSDDPGIPATSMMTNDSAATYVQNGNAVVKIDSAMVVSGSVPEPNDEPVLWVPEPPEFPGGTGALQKFIADNIIYPSEAIDINLQGKVIVKFAVLSDGSVSRIEVYRSINPLLDQEAVRVISIMPKWKPGKQNGVPVSVWFIVPVNFQLK
ncbi:MAG: energy transducer TonB [Bacteroidales bacterium]|jgi:protein TonB